MYKLATFVFAFVLLSAAPASAADPEWPWRYDHWPQQQPWQEDAPSVSALRFGGGEAPQPIDEQNWVNPDNMTWQDYRKPPGTSWADPSVSGSVRTFRGALVLLDYPNQPFVVTQPQGSTVFANPSAEASGIPREQLAQFYEDFLNTPGQLNRGHTLHEYWMEDSGGRYGVELTGFGPYTMPAKDHEYGIDNQFQRGEGCPSGDTCNRNIRTHGNAAWVADVGTEVPAQFDFVFFLSAGQDESSTWQEFGPIKFPTKEAVTDDFGPPDPALPNWSRTRYVDVDVVGVGLLESGPTQAAAHRPRPRVPAWPSSRTSSATFSASRTTTTTRSACRRDAPTPASGRCSAAAASTAPAARTAAG